MSTLHAEAARLDGEAARVDGEAARVDGEAARVDGEAARVDAEAAGLDAEAARLAEDPVARIFASRTLTEHLVRGVLGLVLVVAALALAGSTPWALLLAVPGVLAWRGCPTCWALGLSATLARRRSTCVDGSCRRA